MYIFEDNEAVIQIITKGRSPTMKHVSRTHRVALDWLFDRIDLDPEIQIQDIDTKNQLADMLTKGNFTRDEWNHLLCYLTSASSVPSIFLKRCRKEHKKMQEIPGNFKSESQNVPLCSLIDQQTRTGRLVMGATSSNYSEEH